MANENATLRTCSKGHQYYKSSSCPTCPVCEAAKKPTSGFLSELAAPARRALLNNGINTIEALSKFTEADILRLHGMGPGSIPKLRKSLHEQGFEFKKP